MDPDDLQLIQAYLQGGPAPGQQPSQPTTAQVTADILDAWGGSQGGNSQTLSLGGGPAPTPSQAAQPLRGLYSLGEAGLSGDALDDPDGYYDDNAPDYSASPPSSSNPNPVLTASHLTPPGPGPLTPYGPDNPAPLALTPTGEGAGPPPAPNSAPAGSSGGLGQPWNAPAPSLPTQQDRSAANATMLAQGLPNASYTDPVLDALSTPPKVAPSRRARARRTWAADCPTRRLTSTGKGRYTRVIWRHCVIRG